MTSHKVLLFDPHALSDLGKQVVEHFSADCVKSEAELLEALTGRDYKVMVLDLANTQDLDLGYCARLIEKPEIRDLPLVLLTRSRSLKDKLKALEIGCDDFLETSISGEEACARITKSIFHRIATEQIATRLELANQAARSAMVDNSDLGANLQFLLSVHECDNLDQLGQQFFKIIERYGLKCSLQMRSIVGDKNMEAHGMAKDLEAQLLTQMAESGRYIDFGKRTICNYDKVSLLIKNMPVGEPDKYGSIKDNTFCLVQGLNARIHALEDQYRIQQERDALTRLSSDVHNVMHTLKDAYQEVMRSIVSQVETASNLVQDRIPALMLAEADEDFLEDTLNDCVRETNRIFNNALIIDEAFEKLEETVSHTLRTVDLHAAQQLHKVTSKKQSNSGSADSVELF